VFTSMGSTTDIRKCTCTTQSVVHTKTWLPQCA